MTLKSIILAGATLLSLAAPAAAFAQPYRDYDRGYHDRDDRRWRDHDRYDRYDRRGRAWGYGQRCFIENHGYRNWRGDYVSRAVRVCR
jgi:hypothetical protein